MNDDFIITAYVVIDTVMQALGLSWPNSTSVRARSVGTCAV